MCSPLCLRAGWGGLPGMAAYGRVWPWLAAWLLAAILPANVAVASCGDWLEGHALARSQRTASASHGGMERRIPAAPDRAGDGPVHLAGTAGEVPQAVRLPSPPPAPAPCDGPACRRAPLLPPASPVPSPEPMPGESALAPGAAALPDPAADASAARAADARPIRVVGRVPTPPPRPVPAHA